MTQTKEFAETVVGYLDGEWSVGPGHWGEDVYLNGPDGERVHFRVHDGRWKISGDLTQVYAHVPYGAKTDHSITVATSTTALRVAGQISRRLLPDYQDVLVNARDQKADSERAEAERQRLVAELLTACGGRKAREHRNEDIEVGNRYDDGGDIQVMHDGTVKFDVRLPKDLALLVARVIGDGLNGR